MCRNWWNYTNMTECWETGNSRTVPNVHALNYNSRYSRYRGYERSINGYNMVQRSVRKNVSGV